MHHKPDCLFCKMVAGDIKPDVVYEDDTVMAFRDINPQAPTHVLIIPKQHIPSMVDVTDAHAPLLGRMKAAARRLVLVSDLRRSLLGYAFAGIGCRLLSRSDVFLEDGMRSIAAAFTTEEARRLAAESGLDGARLSQVWPQRWLLTWNREGA